MRTYVAHGFEASLEAIGFIFKSGEAAAPSAVNTLPGAIHLRLRLLDKARIYVLQHLQEGKEQIYSRTCFSAPRLNRKPAKGANKDAIYAAQQSAETPVFLTPRGQTRQKTA